MEVGYNSLDQIDVAHQLRRPNNFPMTPSITRKGSTKTKTKHALITSNIKIYLK